MAYNNNQYRGDENSNNANSNNGGYRPPMRQASIGSGISRPIYQQQPVAPPPLPNNPYVQQHDMGDPYSGDDVYSSYSHGGDDSKSYHSNHSQVRLNNDYSTVDLASYPPVPTVPYDNQPQQYPPQPHSPIKGRTSPLYAPLPPTSNPYLTVNTHNTSLPYGPPSPGANSSYSEAKRKLLNRRSVRHVELQQGNLVLDCPVPQSILQFAKDYNGGSGVGGEEFTKMRYTACTSDPDDWIREKYTLRPYLYNRKTELMIVGTMYNEDEVLFCKTMTSVIKNVQFLQSRKKSKTWGDDSWKKVVVVIVSDGRAKVNPKVLKVLGLMGVYQDGIAKDTIAGKDVQAHVFEYSSQVVVDDMGNVSGGIAPVQIVFCLKEQNKKKLNSHRWFFNAFCAQLQPNVTILIDVGTKPGGTSLYHLWKCFDKHKNVGGACGEITVDTGRACSNLLNPLVAGQNFEYKMSNILDKPLESVFGYISVLPGAFSAYRYKALVNDQYGRGPLASYFKGESMHGVGAKAGVFEANMFLAEDRILCFEIVTKKKEAWVLKYVKSAKAATDVPDKVPEFISQRRRWLNGSLFASVHATFMFWRIWTSGHGFFRKIWLQIEFLYNAIQLFFTWTGIANFYLAFFYITTSATANPQNDPFGGQGQEVVGILNKIWIGILFVILVCALGNRPQGSNLAYTSCIVGFALIFGVALYCAGWTIYESVPHTLQGWKHISTLLAESGFRDIVISLGATYGLYLASSLLHAEPWHLFTSFFQYMFLLPSYVNVLGIYSIANLHDVSWGTKGQSGPAKDLGGAKKTQKDGKDVVEVEVPTVKEDIDAMWLHMRKDMAVKTVEVRQKRSAELKQEDHYRNFRTNVVLAFLGTNMIMVIFFTSTFWSNLVINWSRGQATQTNPYMVFIFWSVAGLSAFRFFGSVLYLLLRAVGH